MTVPVEREAKLSAQPGFVLPDLPGAVSGIEAGPVEVISLEATYYDTPDFRLARSGITMRYRLEAPGDGRWTLKLPSGDGPGPALSRAELDAEGGPDSIPEQLADLVQVHVRGEGLLPVAKLHTDRRRLVLVDDRGRELAEVDDDDVTGLRGPEETSRFREIEVELRPEAPPGLLPDVLKVLEGAGAERGQALPKAVRVMGSSALGPPEVEVGSLPGKPAAADVVRLAIAAGVERLMAHDPGVRLGDDPEDVHQARVATRRLRSDLRTFRGLLDGGWVGVHRDELRWVARALGDVRDRDVLLGRLRLRAAGLRGDDARAGRSLLARLEAEQATAGASLLKALRGPRYAALVTALVHAAKEPPLSGEARGGARSVLPPLARKPWKRLASAVAALPPDAADAELHRVRVLAKRARYAAEAVAPVVGRDARAFAEAVAGVQSVLGDHHDAVVAQEWLRAAAKGSPTRALVAGQLLAAERADADALRSRWRSSWRRASRKKLRSWMR